ncbi:hypothetical protein ACS0TY_006193 [Phlomoides rotata]
MFFSILAHHNKNRCVKFQFKRSSQIVSKHFHAVLNCVLRLHDLFLVKPQPIPEDSTDQRWGKFKKQRRSGPHGETILPMICGLSGIIIMEMDPRGNPVGKDVDRAKTVRYRRSWTRFEEDALIHCLTDVVNDGWKAENGFRAGFQRELERGMRTRLSDLNLKVVRYKTWPYYSQWIEIFGKDRATGTSVVDPVEMANDLGRDECEEEGETGEKYVPLTEDGLQDLEDNNICKPSVTTKKTTSKRKCVGVDLSNLVDTLGDFMKYSKDSVGDLSKDIGKGSGHSNVSKQIMEIMKDVVGLKISDKLKVCDELVQNPN